MQVKKVMIIHVDDPGLIIQQIACYFVVLILPPNAHEQGFVNPWWEYRIALQEIHELHTKRFTEVRSILLDMLGVYFSNSKMLHVGMIFPKKLNVIPNFSMIVGHNSELVP